MDARGSIDTLAGRYPDRTYLFLLLILLLPLKGWLVFNTEVPARDCIGYIRFALDFEKMDWREAMCLHDQHPGYSFCVWLVSLPLRAMNGGLDAEIMRLAAQATSVIASLLLLIPMFFLGKELLGARAAFWGCLLFQVLPVSGHHLVDGVSEPLFLLLVTASLWQGVIGLQRGSRFSLFWCGLFGGLAYWTRPEGGFVVAAAGLVLIGGQVLRTRLTWKEWIVRGACLAGPALALAGLFFLATGEVTRKLSPRFIVGWETLVRQDEVSPEPEQIQNGSLFATIYAAFIPRAADYPTRLGRGARTLALELVQAFHYVGAAGVLLGLSWFGGHLGRQRGFWVLFVYGALQVAALMMLAVRLYYVSDRHIMVLVLPGSFLMAAGFLELGRRAQPLLTRRNWAPRHLGWSLPLLLLIALAGFCLPKTLDRVHGNRVGNHLAGLWLKDRLRAGDIVVDDHCWSHYYAGQVFEEGKDPEVDPEYKPICYVVMTRSKIRGVDDTRKEQEAKLREATGHIVYQFPPNVDEERARVVVFALPRDWEKQPWRVARRE